MNVDCIFETTLAGIEYLKENFTVLDVIDANQLSLVDLYMRLEKNYKNILIVNKKDLDLRNQESVYLFLKKNKINSSVFESIFIFSEFSNSNI